MTSANAIILAAVAHRHWLRPAPEITDDTVLSDIADSLDCVSIALGVEEALHREIPSEAVARWITAGDVRRFVEGEMVDG